jgi:hypothetical protein
MLGNRVFVALQPRMRESVQVQSIVLDSFGNIYTLVFLTSGSIRPGAVFKASLGSPNWTNASNLYGNGGAINLNCIAVRN